VAKWFRTKIVRIIAGLALAVALYALAGFVIAPKIVRHALLKDIPETIDATPSIGEIRINPFLFKVEINDFALSGKDAAKVLGFKRLFIDFELSSVWHRAYTFAGIEITAPFVYAAVASDGSVNLAQLRAKATAPAAPPAAKSEPLPRVRIGSFKVTQGTMTYEDRSRPTQFAARLEPINFELKDFTTGVSGGLFTFTGASQLGERVEWHGHLSLQPIESDGEFHIEGLRAHTIWEYLEDQLNFVINSGNIDLLATYKFALKDNVELTANVATVTVTDVAVRPRDSDADWVSLPALTLSGASIDLARRQAAADSLSLSGLKLLTWLEADGSLNLIRLSAPPAPGPAIAAPAGAVLQTASATAPAAPPWRFDLKKFELRDASISAEDRAATPAAKVLLAPVSLTISDASLDLTKPLKVALDTRINESGSLAVSGEVTPQPVAAALHVKLSGLDLTAAQPYLAQRTSMTLRSGKLGADAQLTYAAGKQLPSLRFSGDVYVENLHTVDDVLQDDFINWERLDVRGLNYQQGPDRVEIAEIAARKPYARVIIESDTSLNVTRVLSGPGKAPTGTPAATSPAPPPAKPSTAKRAPSPSADSPAAATQAAPRVPMAIKKILVQGGKANFTDLSVKPNFSAGIQSLEGSILGLSSKSNSRAKVDLHGNVDAFSPVSISGEVNILSTVLYTDLAMDFRNMELSIFNPYSGKFAGYNITKGKLTTELHYKVDGRKLDATHHILIDQLEFGDKTESKDAVSLPVKLAVALLKDRNGVIDLDFPVSGTLDDPKFRIGPLIWKVIVNILEKAVTAPFALLGSLFGGGPDIQFIDFQPGSSTIDAGQSAKVQAVAKALKERPQIKLEVPIADVPEVDGPALVGAAFSSQLAAVQAQKGSRKKAAAGAPPTPFEQLDAAAKLDVLTQLYAQVLGGEPKYPDTVTAVKQKPDLAAAKIDFLTAAVRDHLTVGEDQFKALAQARALALQQALLTGTGVEPERVFLVVNDKAKSKDGAVRLELSLR